MVFLRAAIPAAFLLLLVASGSQAGSVNGYEYSNVEWNEDGFLTLDVVNGTGSTRHGVRVTVHILDSGGGTLLKKTIPIGTLDNGQTHTVRSHVGQRTGSPAQFSISFSDDRSSVEAEIAEPEETSDNTDEAAEANLPPTTIDMTFKGDAYKITESFDLTPGTYYFLITFFGEGGFTFRLANASGNTVSDILTGQTRAEQIVPVVIETARRYRIKADAYGDWSIRIMDHKTMERVRRQMERNQFDVQQSDDGTLVITN